MILKINNVNEKEKIALIDGSSLAHLHANKPNYKDTLKEHIRRICQVTKATYFCIILEKSSTNFRKEIAVSKDYKGQRVSNREKIQTYLPYLNEVFTYIKAKLKPVTYLNVENDDILSILGHKYNNVIIVGNDSDLLSIPGKHYDLRQNVLFEVSLPGMLSFHKGKLYSTGYYNTFSKILKGSQKENYSGVLGCGSKKAFELLREAKTENEMFAIALKHFTSVYGQKEGLTKFIEGFKLCFLLTENPTFIEPDVVSIDYLKIIHD